VRPLRFIGAVAACLLAIASPAWGHGKEIKTDPKRNAELKRPPAAVSIQLTEAATPDAVMKVIDGCDTNVAAHIAVSGETITAHLVKGKPGRYQVQWKVISAVDGHPTDGKYSFTVAGDGDCSDDTAANGDSGGGGGNDDAGDEGDGEAASAAPTSSEGEDDSSFPIVPVALGAVGVIAVGLGARFAASR
jgi:methionine-rich copper-binding protein CopC